MQIRLIAIAVSLWFATVGVSCFSSRPATDERASVMRHASRLMPDGREWMTENLNVDTGPSYCYDGIETKCRQYGRLYTWESARRACESLRGAWRLPTEADWRQLAKYYGGDRDDSSKSRRAAYRELMIGGSAGFNAVLGGGGIPHDRTYTRLEAHGFYWTSSESTPGNAWFYNFAKGQLSLFRQSEGEKYRALSVRCVRD